MRPASTIDFLVKVCGITEEADGVAAIEAGAHALGFNFYGRSPRYVTLSRAKELAESIDGDYLRVGVFVNPSQTELAEALIAIPLDVVQLHGGACAVPPPHTRVWRSVVLPANDLRDHTAEAYLLDSPSANFGGSGRSFDWSLAAGFPHRAILAGGLDESNVRDAIRAARPWGVDACSRLERQPGRKDGARVRAFVTAALEQARALALAETTT